MSTAVDIFFNNLIFNTKADLNLWNTVIRICEYLRYYYYREISGKIYKNNYIRAY